MNFVGRALYVNGVRNTSKQQHIVAICRTYSGDSYLASFPPPPRGPFLVTTMPESAGSQHNMHGHSQRLHVGEAGCVQSWV